MQKQWPLNGLKMDKNKYLVKYKYHIDGSWTSNPFSVRGTSTAILELTYDELNEKDIFKHLPQATYQDSEYIQYPIIYNTILDITKIT